MHGQASPGSGLPRLMQLDPWKCFWDAKGLFVNAQVPAYNLDVARAGVTNAWALNITRTPRPLDVPLNETNMRL